MVQGDSKEVRLTMAFSCVLVEVQYKEEDGEL